MKRIFRLMLVCIVSILLSTAVVAQSATKLLPNKWDVKTASDKVLQKLVTVTALQVRGAHDAEMVMAGNYAYIVSEVNDFWAGEAAAWPFVYISMSVINLQTLKVENVFTVATSMQAFENETLPIGACFVPRIIQKDSKTLRIFFASENPGIRQSQTWYRDFNLEKQYLDNNIYHVKLKTSEGTFYMQPKYLYSDAAKVGFKKKNRDFGLYIFDSFKVIDGKIYVAINNYATSQNALAILNKEMDTFEVVGHFNEPQDVNLCESSVNRLPDGTWMAIIRQDGGNFNYLFSTSKDGVTWTVAEPKNFVPNGDNSKPTFDKFNGVYYLGWQEMPAAGRGRRSIFNIDISKDGVNWERKYHFEGSFQYPTFREYNGSVWLVTTQGNKKSIAFGKLEDLPVNK